MKELTGQLNGDHVIREDSELRGQIAGSCRVVEGATLIVRGQVAGDLIVDGGAQAAVHGMVAGNLTAEGDTQVFGMVVGRATGAGLRAERGSHINGVKQP